VKKVAIVGSQPDTRENAPFDDDSYEIWSFADWICYDWLKRCTGLFEIHSPRYYIHHPRTPHYWEKLQTLEIPVWMYPVADPKVPGAIEYPLDGVLSLVGKGKQNGLPFKPLNCSTAYAIGLAVYLEYDVIDVYGVELNTTSEYMHQKGHFAFWNGVAIGRGIELNINCSEGLFVQPLYGFEDDMPTVIIGKYMEAIAQQVNKAEKEKLMAQGALQLASKLMKYRDAYNLKE
jgi:hypothetical protein